MTGYTVMFIAGLLSGISIGFNIAHGVWKNTTDDAIKLAKQSMHLYSLASALRDGDLRKRDEVRDA